MMKLVKFIIILNKSYIVTSVRIWNYSGPYSDRMRENTDQKNSEYEHFSPVKWELAVHETLYSIVESSTSFLLNSKNPLALSILKTFSHSSETFSLFHIHLPVSQNYFSRKIDIFKYSELWSISYKYFF